MKAAIPSERHETIRQELRRLLSERKWAVNALSKAVRLSEKEIYAHLELLRRAGLLSIVPAECGDCRYAFAGREKAKKPSKCPKCKGTYINPPLFTLKSKQAGTAISL
ncbi:MAG: ArsR family transcriptional regulator [Candidatus Competibacteraceae bacterium]|nr:ArsR family transcriptional regulator [Candidatus Competibacteraceae bacterium]